MEILKSLREWSPKLQHNGQIRMKCPFRDKHTDGSGSMSMFLSPDINAYHCFSCGSSGNLVNLLVKVLKFDLFEASVIISGYVSSGYTKPVSRTFEIEYPWVIGESDIFTSKGISAATQKMFRVGMTEQGWTAIPYYFSDELVGVQYRIIKDGARILDNAVFPKSEYVYNYHPDKKECTLVEGYTDVFRLQDFKCHATALWGSSFSDIQCELISRYEVVNIATDNDIAGRRVAEVINRKLSRYETTIFIVPYPFKDPGECSSKKEWDESLSRRVPYSQYSFEMSENPVYLKIKNDVYKKVL